MNQIKSHVGRNLQKLVKSFKTIATSGAITKAYRFDTQLISLTLSTLEVYTTASNYDNEGMIMKLSTELERPQKF